MKITRGSAFYPIKKLKNLLRWEFIGLKLKLAFTSIPRETPGETVTKLIAVIDDEEEMEDIYTMLLQQQIRKGLLDIRFFSDARVFVDWLISHSPDLIMTDMNMPHINGVKLIDHISKAGRKVPTYIITGDDPKEIESLMGSYDFVHFLAKPFHFDQILSLIQRELGIVPANLER